MFKKLRPIIFKFSPEVAHSLAIKALKTNLLPSHKLNNPSTLSTNLFGKNIKTPVGVAAGFDKNAEVYNPLFNLGFGFVEVGTITPKPQYGNPKPRVFRLEEDNALINRLGLRPNLILSIVLINCVMPSKAKNSVWSGTKTEWEATKAMTVSKLRDGGQSIST